MKQPRADLLIRFTKANRKPLTVFCKKNQVAEAAFLKAAGDYVRNNARAMKEVLEALQ